MLRTAMKNNWCAGLVSVDFFHVLIHFDEVFDAEWIREMTKEKKDVCCLWDDHLSAYQAAGGSHFYS